MCTISDHSVWKLYLLLTDGKTLPTIRQHMAKIFPFLESKADIFSSYLPVSDINLAKEKSIWHNPLVPIVVCASCLHLWMILCLRPSYLFAYVGFRMTFKADFDENVKTTCCHNNFQTIWRTAVHWQKKKTKLTGWGVLCFFCLRIHMPHIGIVNYLHKEWYENYLSIYQHYNFWHAKCAMLLTVTVHNMGDGW